MTRDEEIKRATLEAAAKQMEHDAESLRMLDYNSRKARCLDWEADVIRAIDPASIEVSSPWVSVKDRLPDDDLNHFVACIFDVQGCCVMVAWKKTILDIYTCAEGITIGTKDAPAFTHWMPIPPLPEGK